jgi:hypothetical protein
MRRALHRPFGKASELPRRSPSSTMAELFSHSGFQSSGFAAGR